MKCPKCGYLGFDHVDRCRNCGYDFSLATDTAVPELSLRGPSAPDGFADLSLVAPRPDPQPTADLDSDLDRILSGEAAEVPMPAPPAPAPAWPGAPGPAATRRPAPVASPSNVAPAASAGADELPLFGGPITDDVPLITRASPPRPPLAVRRATPEVPRLRSEPSRTPPLDLALDLDVPETPVSGIGPIARARAAAWPEAPPEPADAAGIGARLAAGIIDILVLALIDVIVVYFTMQICELTFADIAILPKGPLLAFLAVQNGGYLVAFTVGGQTLGKMATGIKVVTAGSGSSLDVGRAALRTLMWVVLAIPAGLGFLSAVFSADHRGLHDRFAGTRVVRTSA